MGIEKTYYEYIKETWSTDVLQGGSWNKALQDGVYVVPTVEDEEVVSESEEEQPEIVPIASALRALVNSTSPGTELVLYSKVGMGDGRQAKHQGRISSCGRHC
mgnify:CR=1 FL=1